VDRAAAQKKGYQPAHLKRLVREFGTQRDAARALRLVSIALLILLLWPTLSVCGMTPDAQSIPLVASCQVV
jgi:hypothetical protein